MNKMIKPEVAVCECLKGVAHPVRINILTSLKDGELSAGEIESKLKDVSQSNLSQHLNAMYSKGALGRRKVGNQMIYFVSDKRIFKLLSLIKDIFCEKG